MKTIMTEASVSIEEDPASVILENSFLRVCFDKNSGFFQIADAQTAGTIIKNSAFQINGELSCGDGKTLRTDCKNVSDPLGSGLCLTVSSISKTAPDLLLQLTLYHGKPFLSLAAGVRNTTQLPYRMKCASVLSGSAFERLRFSNYQVLNGESDETFTALIKDMSAVSKNNLLVLFGESGSWHSCGMGGLTYHDFEKFFRVVRCFDCLNVELWEEDPVGRLVDPGETYLPDDRFYFDPITADPFLNLENYGAAIRAAQKIELSSPTYLVLNHWYPSQERFGKMEGRNHTAGTVLTMDEAVRSRLTDYAATAVRLESDDYSEPNNQQGWWDDEHFKKYQSGTLTKPYDSIQKWGDAIAVRGGACMVYCQSGRRSEDYAQEFPGHMLFNCSDAKRSKGGNGWWNGGHGDECWGYDYTDPDFQKHLREVYRNYRQAGVKGIKFDYPDSNWCYDGGFEDRKATAASAYRDMFRPAREMLDEDADIQDRLGRGDLSAGLATTKRTEADMDRLYPPTVTRSGMKWYKNRVIYNVDTDAKNPLNAVPNNLDGVRAMFTMTYVVSGRMELGIYPAAMDSERQHALTRIFPFHTNAQSARPADLFSGKKDPQVYDYEISPQWHEVTFYNTALEKGDWPESWEGIYQDLKSRPVAAAVEISLSGDQVCGSLRLNPTKTYYIYDFWNDCLVGVYRGFQKLRQELRPGEARMMSVHEAVPYPQFLSTNRHIMQGYVDMAEYPKWNLKTETLSGCSRVTREDPYEIVIARNGYSCLHASAGSAACELIGKDDSNDLCALRITSQETGEVPWSVSFARKS